MEIIFNLTVKASLIKTVNRFLDYFILFEKNRFLDLNSSFLLAHLWESTTAEHLNLLVTRLYRRRSSNFSIQLSESGGPYSGPRNFCLNPTIASNSSRFVRITANLARIWFTRIRGINELSYS